MMHLAPAVVAVVLLMRQTSRQCGVTCRHMLEGWDSTGQPPLALSAAPSCWASVSDTALHGMWMLVLRCGVLMQAACAAHTAFLQQHQQQQQQQQLQHHSFSVLPMLQTLPQKTVKVSLWWLDLDGLSPCSRLQRQTVTAASTSLHTARCQ
jgi:hypothetical protein